MAENDRKLLKTIVAISETESESGTTVETKPITKVKLVTKLNNSGIISATQDVGWIYLNRDVSKCIFCSEYLDVHYDADGIQTPSANHATYLYRGLNSEGISRINYIATTPGSYISVQFTLSYYMYHPGTVSTPGWYTYESVSKEFRFYLGRNGYKFGYLNVNKIQGTGSYLQFKLEKNTYNPVTITASGDRYDVTQYNISVISASNTSALIHKTNYITDSTWSYTDVSYINLGVDFCYDIYNTMYQVASADARAKGGSIVDSASRSKKLTGYVNNFHFVNVNGGDGKYKFAGGDTDEYGNTKNQTSMLNPFTYDFPS